ncbi:MAG: hypothetical protein KAI66_01500, partial [Lentisphaeria bacterium]|nr:hypothetical protein [Lentisphaeria bacterium]
RTYLPCAVRKGTAAVDIGPPGIRGVRRAWLVGSLALQGFAESAKGRPVAENRLLQEMRMPWRNDFAMFSSLALPRLKRHVTRTSRRWGSVLPRSRCLAVSSQRR